MKNIHIITNDSAGNMYFVERKIRNNGFSPEFYCDIISLADLKKNIPDADICILVEETRKQIFPYLNELIDINPQCIFIYYWDTEEKQHELLKHVVQRKRGSYVTLAQKVSESMNLKTRA
jgi:hypothetical protein